MTTHGKKRINMNIKGLCRLIRLPNLLFIIVFQVLLRYWLILPKLSAHGIEPALSTFQFILLVIATTSLAAGGNAINDYFDVEADKINRPDRLTIGNLIRRRSALLTHVISTLIGIFAGLYLSFMLRRPAFLLLFVTIPVLLWFYSTHFKKQILVGNILVALLVALTGYMVVSVEFAAFDRVAGGPNTGAEPLSGIWYMVCAYSIFAFISNLGREIIKDMEDAEGDKLAGCHTLVIELGATYSKSVIILVQFVLLFGCTLALYNQDCEMKAIQWAYSTLFILIPTIILCVMVAKGKSRKDFHRASILSKVVMAMGLASIFLTV